MSTGTPAPTPHPVHRCTDSSQFGVLAAGSFVSFTFLATLIILNLFVGVILAGVADAEDAEHEKSVDHKLRDVASKIQEVEAKLRLLRLISPVPDDDADNADNALL